MADSKVSLAISTWGDPLLLRQAVAAQNPEAKPHHYWNKRAREHLDSAPQDAVFWANFRMAEPPWG